MFSTLFFCNSSSRPLLVMKISADFTHSGFGITFQTKNLHPSFIVSMFSRRCYGNIYSRRTTGVAPCWPLNRMQVQGTFALALRFRSRSSFILSVVGTQLAFTESNLYNKTEILLVTYYLVNLMGERNITLFSSSKSQKH